MYRIAVIPGDGIGAEVVAAGRSTSSKKRLAGLPVEWREADLRDPETVPPLTEGVDYVFHVAAGFREAKLATDAETKVLVLTGAGDESCSAGQDMKL